jgi:uncharacterized UPF0160 family protein
MRALTHDGIFTADTVFAAAILKLTFGEENLEIVRSRDSQAAADADIVFDTGGVYNPHDGRFDHSQQNSPKRRNGIPNAAASLLWAHHRREAIDNVLTRKGYKDSEFFSKHFDDVWKYIAGHIDYILFTPIDVIDNGAGTFALIDGNSSKHPLQESDSSKEPNRFVHFEHPAFTLSTYIKGFNVSWWENNTSFDQDSRFSEAVEIASNLLESLIEDAFWFQKGRRSIIDQALETHKTDHPHILVLEEYIPCKSHLFAEELKDVDIQFVVFPVKEGDSVNWKVAGVPPSKHAFYSVKTPLPASWKGLYGEELQKVSGYEDAMFCHSNLSFAVVGSRESAMSIAQDLVEHERVSDRPDFTNADLSIL